MHPQQGAGGAAAAGLRTVDDSQKSVLLKKKKCRIRKLDRRNTPMVSGRSRRLLFYCTLPLTERGFSVLGEEARVSPPEGTSQTCLLFTLDTARGQLVQGEALSACLGLGLTTWWRGAGYPSPEGTRGQGLPERARRGRLLQRALANRGALGAPLPRQVSPTFHLHWEDCSLVHPEQAGPGWSLAPGAEIPALPQLPGAETAGGVSCCCPPPGRALSPGLGPAPAPSPSPAWLAPTRVGAEGESAAGNIPDL